MPGTSGERAASERRPLPLLVRVRVRVRVRGRGRVRVRVRVSIDMVSYPRSRSVDATVTAVASPWAISIAKEGPERYASGRSGPSTSTITSDIICSVPVG